MKEYQKCKESFKKNNLFYFSQTGENQKVLIIAFVAVSRVNT